MSAINLCLLLVSIVVLLECSPKHVSCYSVPPSSTSNHHNRHSHHHHQRDHHQVDHQTHRPRSSSRFAQLDRILDRLDSDGFYENTLDDLSTRATLVDNSSSPAVATTESWLLQPVARNRTPPPPPPRNQPLIPRINVDSNDNGDDDDDDYDDYDDDVNFGDGSHQPENEGWIEDKDGVQAQADTEMNLRSPYSEAKWRAMGNRAGVDMLFENYRRGIQNRIANIGSSRYLSPEMEKWEMEFKKHKQRIDKEGLSCDLPRPTMVQVERKHPSTNKIYKPACTILHKCSDDTGCCKDPKKHCLPKKIQHVQLYFQVTTIHSQRGSRTTQETSIQKLSFENHTMCECQEVKKSPNGSECLVYGSEYSSMPGDASYQQRHTLPRTNYAEKVCQCPSEYSVRHLANGSCICDCFDKQRDCIKYKKGNEYFSHKDRLCIQMETCQEPTCDFGVYLKRSGRCPKKDERFRAWRRFK